MLVHFTSLTLSLTLLGLILLYLGVALTHNHPSAHQFLSHLNLLCSHSHLPMHPPSDSSDSSEHSRVSIDYTGLGTPRIARSRSPLEIGQPRALLRGQGTSRRVRRYRGRGTRTGRRIASVLQGAPRGRGAARGRGAVCIRETTHDGGTAHGRGMARGNSTWQRNSSWQSNSTRQRNSSWQSNSTWQRNGS